MKEGRMEEEGERVERGRRKVGRKEERKGKCFLCRKNS